MPNGSHMKATKFEQEVGRVKSLLDELVGRVFNHSKSSYHKEVYDLGITIEQADNLVAELCTKCEELGIEGIKQRSLELQIWWRDHQLADNKKAEEILENLRKQQIKHDAYKKLTAEEREILGV